MIRFIDEHRDRFGVEAICRTLRATTCGFITSRAYRAAKTRPASVRALRDEGACQVLCVSVRGHGGQRWGLMRSG